MVKPRHLHDFFVIIGIELFFAIILTLSSNAFAQASDTLKFQGRIIAAAICSATLNTNRGSSPSATVIYPSNQQMRSTSLVLHNGSASSNVAHAFIEPADPDKDTRSYSMV